MNVEEQLRRAFADRVARLKVGDPAAALAQRVAAARHRRRRRTVVGGLLVLMLVAAPLTFILTRGTTTARTGVARSRLARDTHPVVPAADLAALERGNTAAALNLYRQLAATPGNVFFSPYSISTALAMASAGARSETLTQILAVLQQRLPPDAMHRAMNALNLALLAPRPFPPGSTGEPLQLQFANSMWAQSGYHIEPGFLDVLARAYGAALNTADYQHDAAGAVRAINRWADANTNHKIPQLLSQLDPATRLVLVNALYFKASWIQPFDAAQTRSGPFHTANRTTVTVPFMHATLETGYASGDGWQAVDLPYVGNASMTFIVPDAGRLDDFERSLDAAQLDRILQSLQPTEVTLALPKLHLSDQADLTRILQQLGMTDALRSGSADFSGITGNRDLYVSQVVHQATIDLDEKGTEAAAATGVLMATSGASRQAHIELDHPYLLLVRDHVTGTILFLGRVNDPTQTSTNQP